MVVEHIVCWSLMWQPFYDVGAVGKRRRRRGKRRRRRRRRRARKKEPKCKTQQHEFKHNPIQSIPSESTTAIAPRVTGRPGRISTDRKPKRKPLREKRVRQRETTRCGVPGTSGDRDAGSGATSGNVKRSYGADKCRGTEWIGVDACAA